MSEICTPPRQIKAMSPDAYGEGEHEADYECFGEEHTLADIARWIAGNETDAEEIVHMLVEDHGVKGWVRADIAQAELDAAVQAERDGIRSLAREITANTRGPSQYDVGYRDCAMFFDAAIRERGE